MPFPTRRALVWLLLLLAAAPLQPGCSRSPAPPTEAPQTYPSPAPPSERPNFVVVLCDDLDERALAGMPRLAEHFTNSGTRFSNNIVSSPLCCPSRASLLLGKYPHNHRVRTNKSPEGGYATFRAQGGEKSNLATWLHDAGYRTALIGKYLNEFPEGVAQTYIPPGWDTWIGEAGGFASSNFNYTLNENGKTVEYRDRPEDYLTDVLAEKTTDYLRRVAGESKPFFLWLATSAPHSPAFPAPRHEKDFKDIHAPRSPAFNEADVSDKPGWLKNVPPLAERKIEKTDRYHRKRLQSMRSVDELVGKLIETLRATNRLDSTYIFFLSDNGLHMGEHRLFAVKQTPYEESIRISLFARGPGIAAGRTIPALALNTDLAPTIAELAGVPIPTEVDGRSLVPLMKNTDHPPANWRTGVLIEHTQEPRQRTKETPKPEKAIPDFAALRTGTFLYVEYTTGEREYYDLKTDPAQLGNLAHTLSPTRIKELSEQLQKLRACRGAECRTAEDGNVRP